MGSTHGRDAWVALASAAVHNAYIEQLDSSVYNIELYTILSYLL